ncbi:MAG: undecaprenyldiphospho-muramoylpentapeptide beta-N-acetylglucosaminyltransferase [Verrucomicrobia bacterium]|nr:undecaprenyldiphospho-muramoylpentapeptide beta-N-acetylglucosaminyltransferase [Verrucomicrobiota bacterium]
MKKTSNSIFIAAGGTGGHLFPAQALAAHLQKKQTSYEITFIGKGLATNAFFRRDLFFYKDVASAPFSRVHWIKNLAALCKGTWQSLCFIRKNLPSVVVGFGSFHSFPVLLAAKLLRIPIVLFESNSVPGRVNRLFSYVAAFSTVQFPVAKQQLKGKCFEVNVPFWRFKENDLVSKEEALSYFCLNPNVCTLLVFGGSQGARFINEVVIDALRTMGKKAKNLQVIHLTGNAADPEEVRKAYEDKGITACVKAFEENMQFAWSLADVALCRSGAATLSELIHFGVPAILIPYPHAAEGHQLKNALFMEDVGGAFCLEEKSICTDNLRHLIEQFVDNNNRVLQTMKASIKIFKEKQASCSLSDLVEEFIQKKEGR